MDSGLTSLNEGKREQLLIEISELTVQHDEATKTMIRAVDRLNLIKTILRRKKEQLLQYETRVT